MQIIDVLLHVFRLIDAPRFKIFYEPTTLSVSARFDSSKAPPHRGLAICDPITYASLRLHFRDGSTALLTSTSDLASYANISSCEFVLSNFYYNSPASRPSSRRLLAQLRSALLIHSLTVPGGAFELTVAKSRPVVFGGSSPELCLARFAKTQVTKTSRLINGRSADLYVAQLHGPQLIALLKGREYVQLPRSTLSKLRKLFVGHSLVAQLAQDTSISDFLDSLLRTPAYIDTRSTTTLAIRSDARVIGQFANCTVLVRSANNLLALDQHAASERIHLEYLISQYFAFSSVTPSYPITAHLDCSEAVLLRAYLPQINIWGFKLDIHHTRVEIVFIPSFYERYDLSTDTLIDDLLSYCTQLLKQDVSSIDFPPTSVLSFIKHCPRFLYNALATASCRRALKFGVTISKQDMKTLWSSLNSCAIRFHCAHGRPTIVPIMSMTR
ncbi:hypothetical protein CANCADRAFT_3853 [Tortispora caseinolytica NRRL Y-17796]|uniref:MutL C-terminal dimerisation domain-containing protein n=1 Tax=Tortispora caseinolytica NRRL Y-17796 TaxID=767744 RepID=A0A1E4TBV0_9ASCO|nr:hypothetical protein CANCADRAFT_3853 [Tortispora caseinolytica NRRL Y-17796]